MEALKNFYLGLVHFPVVNRHGEIVTSSVTNLDLHDISRACRTYGARHYFVIHPSKDQQALNRRIIRHWQGSWGTRANPTRGNALDLIQLVYEFDKVLSRIQELEGQDPLILGTSAKAQPHEQFMPEDVRKELKSRPVLLLFGTAYGLARSWNSQIEGFLPPLKGPSDYNHLSVRSAVSIYLDRLFGDQEFVRSDSLTNPKALGISEG